MTQPTALIVCLIGAPACGKSSLSLALQDHFSLRLEQQQQQQQIHTVRVVSFDAVEAELQSQSQSAPFDVAAWRQVMYTHAALRLLIMSNFMLRPGSFHFKPFV
jgi:hypothetical protein